MAVATDPEFVATEQQRLGSDMEQQHDETEQAKRAGEWDAARERLSHLIDNPEKHLTISEYSAHLKAAQKAVARAYKAMLAGRG